MTRPARRDPSNLVQATGFRGFVRGDWGPIDRGVRLVDGAAEAAARHRDQLRAALPGARIAAASGWAPARSNDTDYDFRPDSDFSWLTGCSAEGAVLVMYPDGDAELFLHEPAGPAEPDFFANARDGELWIGPVPGLAEWASATGLRCRPIQDLPSALRGKVPAVHSTFGVDPLLDSLTGPDRTAHLRRVLAELRRVKDDWEIGQLQSAVDATVQGFADVAAELKNAVESGGERWLQGTFDRRARTAGNGPGYASIVAAGPHAPVLHWVRNNGPVPEDAVLLLDAGVEMNTLYTADITRTLPVSGRYNAAQKQIHDLVEQATEAALAAVRPGAPYMEFHRAAMRVLATGLHDWGLLPVTVDEALDDRGQHHRRYIVCGVGHFLGLDVHDCASSSPEAYHQGTVAAGMTLAVEPGLYFHPNDETVPPELRGIGVRIEENVVVTDSGNRVLSTALPRDASGLEAWVSARR
ncbi:Xaa-Pro aminopeptidase [Kibdelosporangium philippinense]|uniref:Xaa-Pro aminopeptidase n=1 Tax=Kibdelosporangium philippinense TaxID=211113 RepID=A0ABS8Z6W2_9PSEU|nr:aminopeptidase P family protein [Kibdelosporangium philippinense]MCE7003621.1 Xaa-Pro aminopeptidase [Kibdelosporangium philippinense]